MTSTAVLFAKTTIHMSASSLIILGALGPSAGIIGAIAWPIAQKRLNLTNLHAMIILVGGMLFIPIYGCLGFLPIFRPPTESLEETDMGTMKFGGLTTAGEMYVLATYFGEHLVQCCRPACVICY